MVISFSKSFNYDFQILSIRKSVCLYIKHTHMWIYLQYIYIYIYTYNLECILSPFIIYIHNIHIAFRMYFLLLPVFLKRL